MANFDHRKSDVLPAMENYSFLHPPHLDSMNSYLTSLPFPTSRFVDHCQFKSDFQGNGHLCVSQKPDLPLRQRHLPASFWKEPNVPKYSFPEHCLTGRVPSYWNQTNMEYKDFVDRLRTAQLADRLNTFGSRFPITEFLYNNYGLKNRAESTGTGNWPPGQIQKCKKPSCSPLSTSVCPYSRCACSDSNSETNNAGLETAGPPRIDVMHSPVWKPIATKTSSSHPTRFHPFAHAR